MSKEKILRGDALRHRSCLKVATFGLVVLAWSAFTLSCFGPPKLEFAESAGIQNPPKTDFTVWIPEVKDLSSNYREQFDAYALSPSFPQRVTSELAPRERVFLKNKYKRRVRNPFVVVPDSAAANYVLRITVVEFAYSTIEELKKTLTKFALLHPQGFLATTCWLEDRATGAVVYEFDTAGFSTESTPRRKALEEALNSGAKAVADKLLEPIGGY